MHGETSKENNPKDNIAMTIPIQQPNGDATVAGAAGPSKDAGKAPTYVIPPRRLGALEHPMIIKNLDKGMKTFGQNNSFQSVRFVPLSNKVG